MFTIESFKVSLILICCALLIVWCFTLYLKDYAVSTNRPSSRGATVKTHKTSAATGCETESGLSKGNNRNCNKNNINNNNNISSAAVEVQRKRQHSPEEQSAHINGNITGSRCDLSKIGKLLISFIDLVLNGICVFKFIYFISLVYAFFCKFYVFLPVCTSYMDSNTSKRLAHF